MRRGQHVVSGPARVPHVVSTKVTRSAQQDVYRQQPSGVYMHGNSYPPMFQSMPGSTPQVNIMTVSLRLCSLQRTMPLIQAAGLVKGYSAEVCEKPAHATMPIEP